MKKIIFSLTLLLFFITPAITFAATPANNNVFVNGSLFTPQAPLLNINDRLMVPFREFGDALGATVHWEQSNQQITMFRENLYSVLHIGNIAVQHGQFQIVDGAIVFTTQNHAIMDAPATLVNGVTYIPLRAVGASLGATVDWNPITATASVNTTQQITTLPGIIPPNMQLPSPEESSDDLPASFGDFSNTSHFSIISSRQAQARFNDSNNYPLVLVVYNSNEHNSKLIVPEIQDAAQRVGYRIFGLDRASSNNDNRENEWIWTFVRESLFTEPSILYIYNRGRVVVDSMPNLNTLDQNLRNFRTMSETGFAAGDFRNTTFFQNVTSNQVRNMHDSGDEFIFILYDSQHEASYHYVPVIKAAAREADHRVVYAVDVDRNPQFANHLSWAPGVGNNISHRLPMMFLVYNESNRNHTDVYDRPTTVSSAVELIEEFLTNSLFHDGPAGGNNNNNNNNNQQPGNNPNVNNVRDLNHSSFFINSASSRIQDMWARGETFSVVVYDSALVSSNIMTQVRETCISSTFRMYAVDLNSNQHSGNSSSSNLTWLFHAAGSINPQHPVVIHFVRGTTDPSVFVDVETLTTTNQGIANNLVIDFIRRVRDR